MNRESHEKRESLAIRIIHHFYLLQRSVYRVFAVAFNNATANPSIVLRHLSVL